VRIGIDARPLRASTGGIRRYALGLIESLAAAYPEEEFVLYGGPRGAPVPGGPNVRATAIDFPGKRWLDEVVLLGREIDVFHGTNYWAPLRSRVPTVVTVHDLSVKVHPETHPLRRRLRHTLVPRHCRAAARVIADSRSTAADLERLVGVPEDRVDVIHLAVAPWFRRVTDPQVCERVQERYALPDAFVLYVGAVEPRKNLAALLRAFATLRREGVATSLVIAGAGVPAHLAELRRVAEGLRLREGRDVLFLGAVGDADLPALYSLCRVFAYPSIHEGFGLPPLEAMACGAPVVLLGNSALKELYADCSVAPANEAGLADALRRALLDEALRRALVARGLERARARTWAQVAAETFGVYRRALGTG
jgi:glycosyltransferase involved in cell wall biosynthesis